MHDGVIARSPVSRRTSPPTPTQCPYVATTAQVWSATTARIQYGGEVVEISAAGVRMSPSALSTYGAASTGVPVGTLRVTSAGYLERAI